MGSFIVCPSSSASEKKVAVIVTSEKSEIDSITVIDVRRIYLGLRIQDYNEIKPVINISDQKLYRDFTKNVMRMTVRRYERKIIKSIFRKGGEKIKQIDKDHEVLEYLKKHPGEISYINLEEGDETKGLKVLLKLW